jgi:hypothetical protein
VLTIAIPNPRRLAAAMLNYFLWRLNCLEFLNWCPACVWRNGGTLRCFPKHKKLRRKIRFSRQGRPVSTNSGGLRGEQDERSFLREKIYMDEQDKQDLSEG